VRVLQDAPTAFLAWVDQREAASATSIAFDSTGNWLAVGGVRKARLWQRDGRGPLVLEGAPGRVGFGVRPDGNVLVANEGSDVRVLSIPDGREIRRLKPDDRPADILVRGQGFFHCAGTGTGDTIRWVPLAGGEPRLVGSTGPGVYDIDPEGVQLALARGRSVQLRSVRNGASPPRPLAVHPTDVMSLVFHPDGRQLATIDKSGEIRIWQVATPSGTPLRALDAAGASGLSYSPSGKWLAAWSWAPNLVRLFSLDVPPSRAPLPLRGPSLLLDTVAFDPSERWLATANRQEIALWPLGRRYPRSIGRQDWFVDEVAFTPDGSSVLSASGGRNVDSTLRAWPLSGGGPESGRIVLREDMDAPRIAVAPRGDRVAVSTAARLVVLPTAAGAPRELERFSSRVYWPFAFSPDGRQVAAVSVKEELPNQEAIRVYDLGSGREAVVGNVHGAWKGDGRVTDLSFVDGDRILVGSRAAGVLLFDQRAGGHKVLSSRPSVAMAFGRKKGVVFAVLKAPDDLVRLSLQDPVPARVFACPGCTSVALDATETVVATGSEEGTIRIGPASGGEPHLFFSRIGSRQRVAFSPDGRWLASSGERPSVRLWPVPDVTRTPLHRLGHDELLATLHSWTNLRALKDPQSPNGWKLEPGPFPGWANLPRW